MHKVPERKIPSGSSQISILILSEFQRITQLLSPWNHQKTYGPLIISEV